MILFINFIQPQLQNSKHSKIKMKRKTQSGIATIRNQILIESEPLKEQITNLCRYEELPDWAKFNKNIIRGYRPATFSYKKCIKSLYHIHNESGNIFTHLFGSFIFLLLACYYIIQLFSSKAEHYIDYLIILSYCLVSLFCLFTSSLYHLFLCHSEEVA